jgi:hypothetical protein
MRHARKLVKWYIKPWTFYWEEGKRFKAEARAMNDRLLLAVYYAFDVLITVTTGLGIYIILRIFFSVIP